MLQPCRQLEPRQLEGFRLLRVSQLDCNQGRNVGAELPDMPSFNLHWTRYPKTAPIRYFKVKDTAVCLHQAMNGLNVNDLTKSPLSPW